MMMTLCELCASPYAHESQICDACVANPVWMRNRIMVLRRQNYAYIRERQPEKCSECVKLSDENHRLSNANYNARAEAKMHYEEVLAMKKVLEDAVEAAEKALGR